MTVHTEGLLAAFLSGFLLGGSLIVAIGAQNAFVLRQGLLRQHVFLLCLICATSDALLISAGVAGLGTLIARSPAITTIASVGGALFLFGYAALAFSRAMHPQALTAARIGGGGLRTTIAACLGFTFLNPHVYLDTVVLIGSISASYDGTARAFFGLGAIAASFVWFFGLGYGARLLQPLFASHAAWRLLDIAIGLLMIAIGVILLLGLA